MGIKKEGGVKDKEGRGQEQCRKRAGEGGGGGEEEELEDLKEGEGGEISW